MLNVTPQVYSATGNVTALPVPVVKNTSLPGQWTYQGCLEYVPLTPQTADNGCSNGNCVLIGNLVQTVSSHIRSSMPPARPWKDVSANAQRSAIPQEAWNSVTSVVRVHHSYLLLMIPNGSRPLQGAEMSQMSLPTALASARKATAVFPVLVILSISVAAHKDFRSVIAPLSDWLVATLAYHLFCSTINGTAL
jgi:hypothetical protein